MGFPSTSLGKESACNVGDPGSIPGSGRSAGEGIGYPLQYSLASMWLRWWRIRLQCGRPRFDPWVGKIPWRRERLPTPVFWPGEFHGLYSQWRHKESDKTEWLKNMCVCVYIWWSKSINLLFILVRVSNWHMYMYSYYIYIAVSFYSPFSGTNPISIKDEFLIYLVIFYCWSDLDKKFTSSSNPKYHHIIITLNHINITLS